MRASCLLAVGVLLVGSCQPSVPSEVPRIAPAEEQLKEAPTPLNDVQAFAGVVTRAIETRDSALWVQYLDTSVTWAEMTAVFGTVRAAKGTTDSVRVARTQTSFKMENGKSSLTWKIFLHGYHEKGTTEQSVVVHHKAGRPWIVGYHVDK